MSSKGTILVTGVNGFVAGRSVEALLEAGYSVRGTVRSLSRAKGTIAALERFGDKFSVVEVPDVSVPGAFDEAAKGVTGVAHLAQPATLSGFGSDPAAVIDQIKDATTGILASAAKAGGVKTVLLMSSVGAVIFPRQPPHMFTEEDWSDGWVDMARNLTGEAAAGPSYLASKVLGERAFWKYREEEKPSFTMTAINPVFVCGPPLVPPETPEEISSSAVYVWRFMNGQELKGPFDGFEWWVDVRDVAKLVAWAFDHPSEADGERYLSKAAWGPAQATADILREAYPNLPIQEGKPGEGYKPGFKALDGWDCDGSKAQRATGSEYIPYDKSVLDTAKSYEPLLSQNKSKV